MMKETQIKTRILTLTASLLLGCMPSKTLASWSLFQRPSSSADVSSSATAQTATQSASSASSSDPSSSKTTSLREQATDMVTSFEQRLVSFVKDTIGSLRYTKYKLGGTKFDADRGVYIVDCSQFVDHVLKETYPTAFSNLVDATGTLSPTTQDYFDFFNGLEEAENPYWNKVEDIADLRAGDILVFRNKTRYRRNMSGHIMVVMDKPIQINHAFYLRVADSAPVRHSQDTRELHKSGVGIGTLLLKVNPSTEQLDAYAWQEGSRWKKNVKFAMARPVEL